MEKFDIIIYKNIIKNTTFFQNIILGTSLFLFQYEFKNSNFFVVFLFRHFELKSSRAIFGAWYIVVYITSVEVKVIRSI